MKLIYSILTDNLKHSLVSVGKTSLITRFMYDSFDNTYQVSRTEMYSLLSFLGLQVQARGVSMYPTKPLTLPSDFLKRVTSVV